jgi:hypothetical protein
MLLFESDDQGRTFFLEQGTAIFHKNRAPSIHLQKGALFYWSLFPALDDYRYMIIIFSNTQNSDAEMLGQLYYFLSHTGTVGSTYVNKQTLPELVQYKA